MKKRQKAKVFLAVLMALSIAVSLIACSSTSGSQQATNTGSESTVSGTPASTADASTATESKTFKLEGKLKNPTIKWLAHWPQNTDGIKEPKRPEMTLFEEKFGGKVEDIIVPYDQVCTRLATLVMSGDPPDLFANMDSAFPSEVNKGLYESIDGYIDYDNDPLWSPLKTYADMYKWEGKHYLPIFNVGSSMVLYYNSKILTDKGIEDPRKLYYAGQWTWDKFLEIAKQVTEDTNKDGKTDIYALNGNPNDNVVGSTGKMFIGVSSDGQVVNNIKDPNIERAMNFLGDLAKLGLADMNTDQANDLFTQGKDVFIADGLWGYGKQDPTTKKVYPFVPFPKDPQADKYYAYGNNESFQIPKGAKNIEGAIAYITCKRMVIADAGRFEEQKKLNLQNGWSDEDLKMWMEMRDNTKIVSVLEFRGGFGSQVNNYSWDMLNSTYRNNKPWSTVRDEFYQKFEDGINYVMRSKQ